jgi:dCTP deaminase
MKLLTDKELHQYVTQTHPIIKDVPEPPGGNWFSQDSSVQPSSIDLHIGEIFLPETKKEEPGHEEVPLKNYVLEAGHTAVIKTRETFSLPDDIAGIGFPPDSVSSQGILMTNPGHIDPGYAGPLHFTLINMGREAYSLREKDAIVTVLLFELSTRVQRDYAARHAGQTAPSGVIQATLNRLSTDFVDVERRAAKIAAREVTKSEVWAAVVPGIVSACIAALIALIVGSLSQAPLQELRTDIRVLQSKADPNELKNQIKELKEELSEMRRQAPKGKQEARQNDIPGQNP